MKQYWILCLVSFVVFVGLLVGGILLADKHIFTHIKDQDDCTTAKACQGDKTCCAVWADGICRRGTVQNGLCVSKGSLGAGIMLITSAIMIIASIVFFILALRKR